MSAFWGRIHYWLSSAGEIDCGSCRACKSKGNTSWLIKDALSTIKRV